MANNFGSADEYLNQVTQGLEVPQIQSPYEGLQMNPNFPVPDVNGPPSDFVGPTQPYVPMTEAEMGGIADAANTRDMARQIAGAPYQEPEMSKVSKADRVIGGILGGLQDALAVISHAKNPNSKAEFGGFAQAMFAQSEYNRGVRNRNAARAEKNLADQAEIGRTIALRKISEGMTGGKDRSTETERFIDYLRKSGATEDDIQKWVKAQLPGTQEYQDVQDGKFRSFIRFRAETARKAAAGDPEAQAAMEFIKKTEEELQASAVEEAKKKAQATQPYRKAGGSEPEGGPSLSSKQKNALQVELDAAEVNDKTITQLEKDIKAARKKEDDEAPMRAALDLPSNLPSIKKMEKELASKKAKAAEIRSRYSKMAGTAPALPGTGTGTAASPDGWGALTTK